MDIVAYILEWAAAINSNAASTLFIFLAGNAFLVITGASMFYVLKERLVEEVRLTARITKRIAPGFEANEPVGIEAEEINEKRRHYYSLYAFLFVLFLVGSWATDGKSLYGASVMWLGSAWAVKKINTEVDDLAGTAENYALFYSMGVIILKFLIWTSAGNSPFDLITSNGSVLPSHVPSVMSGYASYIMWAVIMGGPFTYSVHLWNKWQEYRFNPRASKRLGELIRTGNQSHFR